jgi:PAS domain S-box-containing protein
VATNRVDPRTAEDGEFDHELAELRTIYDHAPMLICTLDAERRVLRANQAFRRYNGPPSGGSVGGWLGCIRARDEPRGCGFGPACPECSLRRAIEDSLATGTAHEAVEQRVTLERDGARRDVVLLGSTVRSTAADRPVVLLYLQDVTDRTMMEEALRDSERRYRGLFEAESDAVLVVDRESGQIVDANAAALMLYGYSREEMMSLQASDVSAQPEETRRSIAAGGTHVPVRMHRRRDGTVFPVEISGSYFSWAGREVHVAAIRDITARRREEALRRQDGERLRALAARLETERESERARVAREMHDELGQDLTALKMALGSVERVLVRPAFAEISAELRERLGRAVELADATLVAVQRLAVQLRPGALDKLGLGPALEAEARRFCERSGVACDVLLPAALPALSPETTTALFRICQECLTNVLRHARATRVTIELRAGVREVLLRVTDDGLGIRDADLVSPRALGLLGMRERAAQLGGEATFQRGALCGTVVTVRAPQAGREAR